MIYGIPKNDYKIPPIYEKLRYNLVGMLRMAFASQLTDENLKYSISKTQRKIEIYPTYPNVLEFFPCIVASISSVDFSHTYLEEEIIYFNNAEGKSLYNGILSVDVNLTVYSKSARERDRIIDHIIMFFKNLFVNHFKEIGIQFRKNMRISDESVSQISGGIVFSNTITIPCSIEYEIERVPDIEELIQQINISDISIFWEAE